MKKITNYLGYIFTLLTLAYPLAPLAAQEEVDRNAQMQLLKQNFMQRNGIREDAPLVLQNTEENEQVRQQNQEYRDATLKAINARKLQLQGVR